MRWLKCLATEIPYPVSVSVPAKHRLQAGCVTNVSPKSYSLGLALFRGYFNISAVRMNLRCLGAEAMASSKYQLSPREEAASLSVLALSVWPLARKQASSIISKKEEGIRE